MPQKEVTIKYLERQTSIPLGETRKEFFEILKKKFLLSEKRMERMRIKYFDKEEDEVYIDEDDDYEGAKEASKFELEIPENDMPPDKVKAEIDKYISARINDDIIEIQKKIKKYEDEYLTKFAEITAKKLQEKENYKVKKKEKMKEEYLECINKIKEEQQNILKEEIGEIKNKFISMIKEKIKLSNEKLRKSIKEKSDSIETTYDKKNQENQKRVIDDIIELKKIKKKMEFIEEESKKNPENKGDGDNKPNNDEEKEILPDNKDEPNSNENKYNSEGGNNDNSSNPSQGGKNNNPSNSSQGGNNDNSSNPSQEGNNNQPVDPQEENKMQEIKDKLEEEYSISAILDDDEIERIIKDNNFIYEDISEVVIEKINN